MQKQSRTTLRDIAEAAEVSVATVSMALAEHPQVNEQTRLRIAALSKRMNYQRRGGGRKTEDGSAGRRYAMVFVVNQSSNMILFRHVQAITERTSQCAAKVELVTVRDDDPNAVVKRVRALAYDVDGLLLAGVVPQDALRKFEGIGVPCVLFGTVTGDPAAPMRGCSLVATDAQSMAQHATQALLAAGHQRIGFFGWGRVSGGWLDRCYRGFRYAYADAGLSLDLAMAHFETNVAQARIGQLAADRVLSMPRGQRPTAFFAPSASDGVVFAGAMRDAGIAVPPGAIVFAGNSDDTALAELADSPMVYEDIKGIARLCLSLLRAGVDPGTAQVALHYVPYKTSRFDRICGP